MNKVKIVLTVAALLSAGRLCAQPVSSQPDDLPVLPLDGYSANVVSGAAVNVDDLSESKVIFKYNLPQTHTVKDGDELTLDQCMTIALDQDPDLLVSRFSAQAQAAALKGSKSAYYPELNAKLAAQKYGAPYTNGNDIYVQTQQQKYSLGSGGLTLKQLLLDFGGRSGAIGASSAAYNAARYDLESLATEVARDIKQYYYSVIRARRSVEVNTEKVAQFEQHLQVARAQFEQGTKPKYDVTKAETDLTGSQLDLIRARNDYELARLNLNTAMFLTNPGKYSIKDTLDYVDYEIGLDAILSRAYDQRPDFQSLMAQYHGVENTIKQAKSGYFPALYANGAYNALGSETPYSQNWNAGVSLELNLFQGMKTKAAVEESTAKLEAMRAKLYAKGRDIYLQAQQGLLALSEAEERIINAQAHVKEASENLQIATVRYRTGISTPLELTDATTSYSNAKLQFISALYDYKMAQADIEKTMGLK